MWQTSQDRASTEKLNKELIDGWKVNKVLRNHKLLATKIQAELQAVSASQEHHHHRVAQEVARHVSQRTCGVLLGSKSETRGFPPQTIHHIEFALTQAGAVIPQHYIGTLLSSMRRLV